MKTSKATIMNVQLDVSATESSIKGISDILEQLEVVAYNVTNAIAKAFESVVERLDTIVLHSGNLMEAFNVTVEKMDVILTLLREPQNSGLWYEDCFAALAEIETMLSVTSTVTSGISSSVSGLASLLGVSTSMAGVIIAGVLLILADIAFIIFTFWDEISGIISTVARWIKDDLVQPIVNTLFPVIRWISKLFVGIGKYIFDVYYNLSTIIVGLGRIIIGFFQSCIRRFDLFIIQPLEQWITDCCTWIVLTIDEALGFLKEKLTHASGWFDELLGQPIRKIFGGLCQNLPGDLGEMCESALHTLGDFVSTFGGFCSDAWEDLVALFSTEGLIFDEMATGVGDIFKKYINQIVNGLNIVITVPFDQLNSLIAQLRNLTIFEIQPFQNLRDITVPQIPLLAQGAVLPANRPFLAMVGDQKHGTNVEAPLETIQEALANVLAQQGMGGDIHITFTGDLAQLGWGDLSVLGSIGWRKPGFPKADS